MSADQDYEVSQLAQRELPSCWWCHSKGEAASKGASRSARDRAEGLVRPRLLRKLLSPWSWLGECERCNLALTEVDAAPVNWPSPISSY
jgi:hypothetical protein